MKRLALSLLAAAVLSAPVLSQAKSCNAGQVDPSYGPKAASGFLQIAPPLLDGNGADSFDLEGYALDSLDNSVFPFIAGGSGTVAFFGIERVTSMGAVDASFGGFGYVVPPHQPPDDLGYDTSVAVDSLDRVVVVEGGNSLLRIWRYLPSGSLDDAFGTSGYATFALANIFPGLIGVTTQGDGKVVVATAAVDPATSLRKSLVLRFNADGSIDSGFGSGGISTITTVGYGGNQRAAGVVVLGDGRIAVSGNQASGGTNRVVAARLLANGAPDPSFGNNGSSVFEFAGATFGRKLAVQADGKLVITGTTFDAGGAFETSLVRVNTDGSLDLGFGTAGQAVYKGAFGQLANNLALQANGKILVAGQTLLDADFNYAYGSITRFGANGQLDAIFGDSGVAALTPAGSIFGNSSAIGVTRAGAIAANVSADYAAGYTLGHAAHLSQGSGSGCN